MRMPKAQGNPGKTDSITGFMVIQNHQLTNIVNIYVYTVILQIILGGKVS